MIPKYAENQTSLSEAPGPENAPASKESMKRPTKITHVPRLKRRVKNPQEDDNWSTIANIALGVGLGVGGVALCYICFSPDSTPIPNPLPIDPNSVPPNPGNSLLDSIVKGVGLVALAMLGYSAVASSKRNPRANERASTNESSSTEGKSRTKGRSRAKVKSSAKGDFDFDWSFTKNWFSWGVKKEKGEAEKIADLMKKEDVKILKRNFLIRKKENSSPNQDPIAIMFGNILQFYRNPKLVTEDSIKKLLEGIEEHVNACYTDDTLAWDLILALRVIKNLIFDAQNFEALDNDFESSDSEATAAIQLSLLGDSQSVIPLANISFPNIHERTVQKSYRTTSKWFEHSKNISRLEGLINKSFLSKEEIHISDSNPETDFTLLKSAYEKRKHSVKSEPDLISKKQNFKLPNLSIKEANLGDFFQILNSADVKSAVNLIDKFDTSTAFPIDLWDFSVLFNKGKILYKDLEGTKILGRDAYKIISNEWTVFNKNLNNCHLNLKEMRKKNEVKSNHSLLCVCNEIVIELEKIQSKIELYKNRNELSSEEFNSLKLGPELTSTLNVELKKIERDHLLVFLGHLVVLTLNGNDNRKNLTKGILKLRDYINNRSSGQKAEMGPGIFGTADFIYNFCLNTLFLLGNDKENFLCQMKNSLGEKEVIVAQARNTGSHYVCDILSDQGVAVLNTSGKSKTLDNGPDPDLENPIKSDNPCVVIPEYFAVSESLYNACEPLDLEKVSVPYQEQNNCYLSAGWLKFCVFLHYFKHSVS